MDGVAVVDLWATVVWWDLLDAIHLILLDSFVLSETTTATTDNVTVGSEPVLGAVAGTTALRLFPARVGPLLSLEVRVALLEG